MDASAVSIVLARSSRTGGFWMTATFVGMFLASVRDSPQRGASEMKATHVAVEHIGKFCGPGNNSERRRIMYSAMQVKAVPFVAQARFSSQSVTPSAIHELACALLRSTPAPAVGPGDVR